MLAFLIIPDKGFAYPGEYGLDFLNIGVGAYSAATGQANYAGIEGAEAVFGNPSLIGYELNGFASYQYLIMDTRLQAAAVNLPLHRRYSFALAVDIFNPGNITGFDDTGQKTGNLKSGDYLIRLGIASQNRINYGVTFSYYEQRLDNVIGRGYGFGFGLSYEIGTNRIGLSADNIGPKFKIGGSSSSLPSKIALSGWFPIKGSYINLSTDFIYSLETGVRLAAGIEYSPFEGFFLRAGSNNDTPIAAGLGISPGSFDFDYSFVPSDLLGDRHLFSITVSR